MTGIEVMVTTGSSSAGGASGAVGSTEASTSDSLDSSGGGDDGADGPKFDIGQPETTGSVPGCEEQGNCECTIPEHVPCDDATTDPFQAMGLNCPGELQVMAAATGPAAAIGTRTSFGNTAAFDPTEGSVYAVIGSGRVAELDQVTPAGDDNELPTHCNDDIDFIDVGTLPDPIRTNDVAGNCEADPSLLGTGDCSNTIEDQYAQGGGAEDYVEMRFDVQVPPDIISFSYDFAFSSTEYPFYFGSEYNDMYIGWLESEQWTGNISFDGAGNPISLNAGFLEYADDNGNLPELAGTCMRQHAATGWLTTTTAVTGGETITVVFAIFDLSDSALDSYVFLDNFEWGCEPIDGPTTEPEG